MFCNLSSWLDYEVSVEMIQEINWLGYGGAILYSYASFLLIGPWHVAPILNVEWPSIFRDYYVKHLLRNCQSREMLESFPDNNSASVQMVAWSPMVVSWWYGGLMPASSRPR